MRIVDALPGAVESQTVIEALNGIADELASYYFWKMFRNYALADSGITAAIEAAVVQAFEIEDEPMISAVQSRMAGRDFWSMKPAMLPSDSAAVQARRVMDDLVRGEAQMKLQAAE